MDILTIVGFVFGGILFGFGIMATGTASIFVNYHGLALVLGGTVCATLINTSFRAIQQSFAAFVSIIRSSPLPSNQECIRMVTQLADTAQREGGLLSLQNVDSDFASGFLKRAITIAIMTGDAREARQILEEEIRQRRISKQENCNFYRTMAILAPMFGLLGTLLGIIDVLKNMSDPTKIGSSMALAITSAFYGIGLSNMFCVPVANKIRLRAIEETQALELILEGVMDIMAGKLPRLTEMHLRGYISARSHGNMAAAMAETAIGTPAA